MPYYVRNLAETDWPAVAEFLDRQHGPSLHTYTCAWNDFMLQFLEGSAACWQICTDGDMVVGVLPTLMRMVPGWGTVMNSLPFQGSFGGALVDRHLPAETQERIRHQLLDAFYEMARTVGAASVMITPHPALDHSDQYRSHGPGTYRVVNRVAQFLELTPGWMKTRGGRDYRSALRLGAEVVVADTLCAEEYRRGAETETPRTGAKMRPPRFYELLQKHFGNAGQATMWLARYQSQTVAGLVGIFSHGSAEYLECWSSQLGRSVQAMDLLMGTFLQAALTRECRYVGMGGTPTEGIRNFKAKWGAWEEPYHYHNRVLEIPDAWFQDWPVGMQSAFRWFFTVPYDIVGGGG